MDYKTYLHDPRAAALCRAVALRRLHSYRFARDSAKTHGDELGGLLIEPPSYQKISEAYDALIKDTIDQPIRSTNVARCTLDLLAAIAEDQIFGEIFQTGITSTEKDRADQVRLIAGLSGWINDRQIAEALVVEREARS